MSGAEAECHATTKCGAYALGTQAHFAYWGIEIRIAGPYSDNRAGLGFGARRGLGKMRHMETRYLRLHAMIARNALDPNKVGADDNPSDVLTKAQTKANVQEAMEFTEVERPAWLPWNWPSSLLLGTRLATPFLARGGCAAAPL